MSSKKIIEKVNYDPLVNKMWQTKGCRFISHARLQRLHRVSIFTISILSAYITAISIMLLTPDAFRFGLNVEALSCITVIATFFVVILTHHENSKNYQVRSDHMHTCSLEILALYNNLQSDMIHALQMNSTPSEIHSMKEEYITQYNNILQRYPENHDDTDYKLFQLNNPSSFNNKMHPIDNFYKKLIFRKAKKNFLLYALYYFFYVIRSCFGCVRKFLIHFCYHMKHEYIYYVFITIPIIVFWLFILVEIPMISNVDNQISIEADVNEQ
jgi:hypothetical protein